MSQNPAIVIVPGSFVKAKWYDGIAAKLKAAGFDKVEVVELATVGRRDIDPIPSMEDDTAQVSAVVEKLANEGSDILLMPHSYGGIPATESLKGLTKDERISNGKKGGVIGVLYTTAVVPAVGESSASSVSGAVDDIVRVEGGWMIANKEKAALLTFSDMPQDEALKLQDMLSEHSLASFGAKLTYPGYKYVPVSYMFTELDQILSPETQQKMIQNIEASGAKLNVFKYNVGHAPHLSNPDAVIDAVKKSLGK